MEKDIGMTRKCWTDSNSRMRNLGKYSISYIQFPTYSKHGNNMGHVDGIEGIHQNRSVFLILNSHCSWGVRWRKKLTKGVNSLIKL